MRAGQCTLSWIQCLCQLAEALASSNTVFLYLNKSKRTFLFSTINPFFVCPPTHPFPTPNSHSPRKGGPPTEVGFCAQRESSHAPSSLKAACPCAEWSGPGLCRSLTVPTLGRCPLWGTYIPHIPCRTDGKPSCQRERERENVCDGSLVRSYNCVTYNTVMYLLQQLCVFPVKSQHSLHLKHCHYVRKGLQVFNSFCTQARFSAHDTPSTFAGLKEHNPNKSFRLIPAFSSLFKWNHCSGGENRHTTSRSG